MRPSRRFDFAVLALGVIVVSTAALLIREAEAPALVIAAYRLSFASLPLLAIAAVRRRPLVASRQELPLTLLAGVLLALHFVFWVASVKQTSVATSVFLVTASPLFVAVASGPLLGEPASRRAWLGIAIAASGAAVMIGDDLGAGGDTLLGDVYAGSARYLRLRTSSPGASCAPIATTGYRTLRLCTASRRSC